MANFQAQEVHLGYNKATVYGYIVQFSFFSASNNRILSHSTTEREGGREKMTVRMPATRNLFIIRIYEFRS